MTIYWNLAHGEGKVVWGRCAFAYHPVVELTLAQDLPAYFLETRARETVEIRHSGPPSLDLGEEGAIPIPVAESISQWYIGGCRGRACPTLLEGRSPVEPADDVPTLATLTNHSTFLQVPQLDTQNKDCSRMPFDSDLGSYGAYASMEWEQLGESRERKSGWKLRRDR